jgi:hypothetical protein
MCDAQPNFDQERILTKMQKRIVELSEVALRVECRTCYTAMSFPSDQATTLTFKCPSCGMPKLPTQRYQHDGSREADAKVLAKAIDTLRRMQDLDPQATNFNLSLRSGGLIGIEPHPHSQALRYSRNLTSPFHPHKHCSKIACVLSGGWRSWRRKLLIKCLLRVFRISMGHLTGQLPSHRKP